MKMKAKHYLGILLVSILLAFLVALGRYLRSPEQKIPCERGALMQDWNAICTMANEVLVDTSKEDPKVNMLRRCEIYRGETYSRSTSAFLGTLRHIKFCNINIDIFDAFFSLAAREYDTYTVMFSCTALEEIFPKVEHTENYLID